MPSDEDQFPTERKPECKTEGVPERWQTRTENPLGFGSDPFAKADSPLTDKSFSKTRISKASSTATRSIKHPQEADIVVPSPSVRNSGSGITNEPGPNFVEGLLHSFRGGLSDQFLYQVFHSLTSNYRPAEWHFGHRRTIVSISQWGSAAADIGRGPPDFSASIWRWLSDAKRSKNCLPTCKPHIIVHCLGREEGILPLLLSRFSLLS